MHCTYVYVVYSVCVLSLALVLLNVITGTYEITVEKYIHFGIAVFKENNIRQRKDQKGRTTLFSLRSCTKNMEGLPQKLLIDSGVLSYCLDSLP